MRLSVVSANGSISASHISYDVSSTAITTLCGTVLKRGKNTRVATGGHVSCVSCIKEQTCRK